MQNEGGRINILSVMRGGEDDTCSGYGSYCATGQASSFAARPVAATHKNKTTSLKTLTSQQIRYTIFRCGCVCGGAKI